MDGLFSGKDMLDIVGNSVIMIKMKRKQTFACWKGLFALLCAWQLIERKSVDVSIT
jgi:hypothetical protein